MRGVAKMIYKSETKIKSIIENYKKNIFERMSIPIVPIGNSMQIVVQPNNPLQETLDILKKEKIFHKKFSNDVILYHYYDVNGNMSYLGYEAGNYRKNAKKKFRKKLKEDKFFADDFLIFQIEIDSSIDEWKQIVVKCKAENLECFTEQLINENKIFSKNTSDPGILERVVPIRGVVRIDSVDKEQNKCYGNPLYINVNYD